MTLEQHQALVELFLAAVDLPEDKRRTYLAQVCGEDSDLRNELNTLLEHHDPRSLIQQNKLEPDIQFDAIHLQRVGDYRILREIGRGGMGVVYEAEQESLGRRVALKVLPPQMAGDSKWIERFQREAQAAARMHHTNIVPVFDVGQDREYVFFAMQLIEGQGLDQLIDVLKRQEFEPPTIHSEASSASVSHQSGMEPAQRMAESLMTGRLRQGQLDMDSEADRQSPSDAPDPMINADVQQMPADDPARNARDFAAMTSPALAESTPSMLHSNRQDFYLSVARIGFQTANALAYAHTRGIIHRDIKPSNLLLDTSGVVWVTDFGLAKTNDPMMTQSGDMLGTIRYMSPERFDGECDVRGDIYSLGLTLYELLVLRPAFDASHPMIMIERIKKTEPTRPHTLDTRIPHDLETIVLKSTHKDPKRRYQSADELADDLRRFILDEPIRARRTSRLERGWRWCRHNKALAGTLAGAFALLLIVSIVSMFAANRFRELNVGLTTTEQEAQSHAEDLEYRLYTIELNQANNALQQGNFDLGVAHLEACPESLRGWEWNHLWHLSQCQLLVQPAKILEGSNGEICDFAYGPLGSRCISADGATIRLWNIASGTATTAKIDSTVLALAYSRRGDLAATLGINGSVNLWHIADDQLSHQKTLRGPVGKNSSTILGLSADGARLLVGGVRDTVHVYRTDSAVEERVLTQNGLPFRAAEISPDGRLIAGTTYHIRPGSHRVLVWDADSGNVLWQQQAKAHEVAFSPDGRSLVTVGGGSHRLSIYDALSGRLLRELPIKEGLQKSGQVAEQQWSIAVNPNGAQVAVDSSAWPTLRVFDLRRGRLLARFAKGPKGDVDEQHVGVSYSPDGQLLLSAGRGQSLCLWDADEEITAGIIPQPSIDDQARKVVFHPDGSRFVTANHQLIRVWSSVTGQMLESYHDEASHVADLRYSHDGQLLASGGYHTGTVFIRDAETGELQQRIDTRRGNLQFIGFSPDARRIAVAAKRTPVQVYDVASGQNLCTMQLSGQTGVSFSPDGENIASCSRVTGRVYLCRADSGKRIWDTKVGASAFDIAFSPDGRILATACSDESLVCLLDTANGEILKKLPVNGQHRVSSVCFSPDGSRVAACAVDGTITVWDALSDHLLLEFKSHNGPVLSLQFSPNGQTLVTAGQEDGTVRLWETQLTAEVVARRAEVKRALEIVASRFQELRWTDAVVASIEHDPTLDAAIRQRAKAMARVFVPRSMELRELATDAAQRSDWHAAVATYDELTGLQPYNALTWHDRGFVKHKLGDGVGALEDFRTGFEKSNVQSVGLQSQILKIYASTLLTFEPEDMRDPVAALQEATEQNRDVGPYSFAALARAYLATGEVAKAVDAQQEAVNLHPRDNAMLAVLMNMQRVLARQ